MEKSPERIKILEKIDEFEKEGLFDQNVEEDPPYEPLKPNEVDYLKKKFSSKINRDVSYYTASALPHEVMGRNREIHRKRVCQCIYLPIYILPIGATNNGIRVRYAPVVAFRD